ncbi:MAG: sugar phosphate nucleotidyltransferase [Ferruginibacter sp.]
MIFSAGVGSRFKPWTDINPKALALVNGKSLLQRNIEYLQQYNITEVVVNVHHFADKLINEIESNNGWGSNISISDETTELLETGGGLLKAKELLYDNEPFITLNADILTDLDINKLIDFHNKNKALISFGITKRETSRYFLFDDNNRLCGWRNVSNGQQKITLNKDPLHQMAYSCVAVFEQSVFDLIKQRGKFSLTETYLSLAPGNVILGYDHSGDKLVDVGRLESVSAAERLFE